MLILCLSYFITTVRFSSSKAALDGLGTLYYEMLYWYMTLHNKNQVICCYSDINKNYFIN